MISERAAAARARLDVAQLRKLDWWVRRLRVDVFAGDQIPKARIPAVLAKRHGLPSRLQNLWRFELARGFRGLYTVPAAPGRGVVLILLEILSHRDYDRLLGYR